MSFKFNNNANSKQVLGPKIVVMGVGGAGCNAVNNMIVSGLKGVNFVIANTDAQSLSSSLCEDRIQLGASLTSGLGAGSAPEIGRQAAEESKAEIEEYIRDANMLFLAAGMGGGTGTGATPVVAKIAKDLGILTVGVVTKPFFFEQQARLTVADNGLAELDKYCDTLIVISNQKLFGIANEETTFADAFKMADNVLVSGVKCVTNLITNPGIVNLDFADVKSVMSSFGRAIMGEGEATGEKRAIKAAEDAITNPLLEQSSIVGATSILINITSGPDITLFEVNDIMERITQELGTSAVAKFGSVIDSSMEGIVRVSIVATGIKTENNAVRKEKQEQTAEQIKDILNSQNQKQETISIDATEGKSYKNDFYYKHNSNPHLEEKQDYIKTVKTDFIDSFETKKEEIIFEDFDIESDMASSDLGNNTFFIPPAARRLNAKKPPIETTYSNNNGLFSRIFNKKG